MDVQALTGWGDMYDTLAEILIENWLGGIDIDQASFRRSLAKKYLDKCCLDCDDDGCMEIGEYRKRSKRHDYFLGVGTSFGWSTSPLSSEVEDKIDSVVQALNILPSPFSDVADELADWTTWASLETSPSLNVLWQDWWTHESDECIGCPEVCSGGSVEDITPCETGLRKGVLNWEVVGGHLNLPPDLANIDLSVWMWGGALWRGSRVQLDNKQESMKEAGGMFRLNINIKGLNPIYKHQKIFEVPFDQNKWTEILCM